MKFVSLLRRKHAKHRVRYGNRIISQMNGYFLRNKKPHIIQFLLNHGGCLDMSAEKVSTLLFYDI